MSFRKVIFWLHLLSGLIAGVVIAIMSATGVAIAFEREIFAWIDREVITVQVPSSAIRKPLSELTASLKAQHPEFAPTSVVVPGDPAAAYTFQAGRAGSLYVDPYTGIASAPRSDAARAFMSAMVSWHRWLGMSGDGRATGKLITGVCNLAFLFLCLSGFYLWFPRSWNARALRPIVWFVRRQSGKARDFNWHNVIGIWSLPVLVVLVATATIFSFGWANRLVFTLAGEKPPVGRGGPAAPPAAVPAPPPGASPLSHDILLENVARAFPQNESLTLTLAPASSRGGGAATGLKPVQITVAEPALFDSRGRTQLEVDPYRGEVLKKTGFDDRTAGARARLWMRFLHTGEAFGLGGKIVAAAATAASLLLVYTGFALTWRRFFGRRGAGTT